MLAMATTRLFRNGNSRRCAFPLSSPTSAPTLDLEIERCGDELRIRPAGRRITGALEALASFSPSFMAAGREQEEQQEREAL
jgi:antitoxin VapB